MFEVFPHTADVGLRVRAANLAALLVEAGRGFTSLLVENLEAIEPRQTVAFAIEGSDPDYLFFDWLNELLYTFETRHLLFSRFEVTPREAGIDATAWGEALDLARHRTHHEIKAVTYHRLRVEASEDGWTAEVILDI
jgi:SHS2 domain-containing protein